MSSVLAQLREKIGKKEDEVATLKDRHVQERQILHREIQRRPCPECETGTIFVSNMPGPHQTSISELSSCKNCLAKFYIRIEYRGGPGEDAVADGNNYKFHVSHRGFEYDAWNPSACSREQLQSRIARRDAVPGEVNPENKRLDVLDLLELYKRLAPSDPED